MDYSPIGNIPSGTLQMDCRDGMACPTTPAGGKGKPWGKLGLLKPKLKGVR